MTVYTPEPSVPTENRRTIDDTAELLTRAHEDAGDDLLAAVMPDPFAGSIAAEVAGVLPYMLPRPDQRILLSIAAVAGAAGLDKMAILHLARRALQAEGCWDENQPADRVRSGFHSCETLAALSVGPFDVATVERCARRLIRLNEHAGILGRALVDLERYGRELATWVGANMAGSLEPAEFPGAILDRIIDDLISERDASDTPDLADGERLPSGMTIKLAPSRRRTA